MKVPKKPLSKPLWVYVAMLLCLLASPSVLQADARILITMPADDREHCMEHMREFLEVTSGILSSALHGDTARIIALAESTQPRRMRQMSAEERAAFSPRDQTRPERMRQVLPAEYRQMMRNMRDGFALLAHDARQGAGMEHTLHQLAQIKGSCIACHRSFRIQAQ